MLIEGLNHVELLMPEDQVEAAARTIGDLLGVPFSAPQLDVAHKMLAAVNMAAGLEIIAPGTPDSPLHGAIAARGSNGGVGPIAWRVASVDTMRTHAESLGIAVAYEHAGDDGLRMLVLSPGDCYGYLASFVERPGVPFPVPTPPGAVIKHLNRIELLTPAADADAAAAFFARLLGTEIPMEYMAEHDVLSATSWEAGVEIFAPGSEKSILNASLAKKGSRGGIGPIVWEVADIAALRERALAQGHRILYQFSTEERHQVCLSADTLFGYTMTFTQMIH